MPYLVHEAPVLPALTVQVAIQRDVCKEKAEGKCPQGSQEPSAISGPIWGWANGSHFQEDTAQRQGHLEPLTSGWGKRLWGGSRVRAQVRSNAAISRKPSLTPPSSASLQPFMSGAHPALSPGCSRHSGLCEAATSPWDGAVSLDFGVRQTCI